MRQLAAIGSAEGRGPGLGIMLGDLFLLVPSSEDATLWLMGLWAISASRDIGDANETAGSKQLTEATCDL